MAEYLRIECGKWVRLPGTNVEVCLSVARSRDTAAIVLRDHRATTPAWDLAPLARVLLVRTVGQRLGAPVEPLARRA